MENKRRRQQKVRYIFFKCLRRILQIRWSYVVSNQDILAKNKIEGNQHRGQAENMEMGRTYPTNGQKQQMLDGDDLDVRR